MAHVVFAASEDHKVPRIVPVLRSIVVVNRPHAVVAVYPEVLGHRIMHLGDGTTGAVLLRGGVAIVDAVVREVRLTVPAVKS